MEFFSVLRVSAEDVLNSCLLHRRTGSGPKYVNLPDLTADPDLKLLVMTPLPPCSHPNCNPYLNYEGFTWEIIFLFGVVVGPLL